MLYDVNYCNQIFHLITNMNFSLIYRANKNYDEIKLFYLKFDLIYLVPFQLNVSNYLNNSNYLKKFKKIAE